MSDVKGSGLRSQKARQTRQRILEAARELFVERGYGATNLQDVATAAQVAVQTIYFSFGNKRTLLKELVDVTVAGDDEPVATMDRPWFRAAMAAETAQEQLRAHVHGSAAVLDRVAPIMRMLQAAAATDAEVAAIWPQGVDPRYVVQEAAAKALMAKPGARTDVPVPQAADVLYALLGPELYLVLVRERGWSPQRWTEWTCANLRAQLCVN
ncbi:helix-turn-helix transcriptional regulator [Micromonospora sp. STR1_7]|uniref:Helix-turn-helix transcriptional regulator n=1 Tax=Micromonospora parastrephiae TaxID=2806101 RepID=A0ABS1XV43_9ACTN|nr:helix-turn-helix domain-containing protein [Micromonospora parastrephiae]MBM0233140.1 helix-turn-helix transcriptional regulator [Micromonospora parastrephiae]